MNEVNREITGINILSQNVRDGCVDGSRYTQNLHNPLKAAKRHHTDLATMNLITYIIRYEPRGTGPRHVSRHN